MARLSWAVTCVAVCRFVTSLLRHIAVPAMPYQAADGSGQAQTTVTLLRPVASVTSV